LRIADFFFRYSHVYMRDRNWHWQIRNPNPKVEIRNPQSAIPLVFGPTRFGRTITHLFIAASLALPDWKDRVRISRVLINGTVGWNNLTTATRADAAPCSPLIHIDPQ
jgi:hypothetical protein